MEEHLTVKDTNGENVIVLTNEQVKWLREKFMFGETQESWHDRDMRKAIREATFKK